MRNNVGRTDVNRGKLIFIGVVFTAILIGLFCRVFYIKTVYGEEYGRRAAELTANRNNAETTLTASRGGIFTRNRQALAISYSVDNVILDIAELVRESQKNETGRQKAEKTIVNLSKYLNISEVEVRALVAVNPDGSPVNDTRYYRLAKNVDKKVTSELLASGVICVYTEEVSKRAYTFGTVAPQVLGFIRGDAKLGLERTYDKELAGVNGRLYRTFENDGTTSSSKENAIEGYSLMTTIDPYIQQYAEEAVKNSNAQFEAETTAAIVMNPNTGEVLAMAQYPPFNNNDPMNVDAIDDARFKTEMEALSEEEQMNRMNQLWTNFAISSSFEPGSIYKPFVIAAGVEGNMVSADSGFFCEGGKVISGKDIGCHYTAGHGAQNLTQALANSCNVALMDIAEKIGYQKFYKYHRDFGFAEKTDIDLPAEVDLDNSAVQYSEADLKNPTQLATSSFGQGFNVTCIQELRAFSALINGGKLMRPYVVSQVVDVNGNVIKENLPLVQRQVVSQETSDYMRKAMQSVMTPEGTGHKAVIKGYAIGGKTGTAQQGVRHENIMDDEFTLSFVAYLPVENPEIILMTVIHKPVNYEDNVTTPAYMTKELMQNIIKYKCYLPTEDPESAVDIHVEADAVSMPDYVGQSIADATRNLNDIGFGYEIIGSGDVVQRQMPAQGVKAPAGSRIYLYAAMSEGTTQNQLVLVPKITDISAGQAVEVLTNAGLTPVLYSDTPLTGTEQAETTGGAADGESAETPEGSSSPGPDLSAYNVTEQMPSAEIYVEPGTQVKLKVVPAAAP